MQKSRQFVGFLHRVISDESPGIHPKCLFQCHEYCTYFEIPLHQRMTKKSSFVGFLLVIFISSFWCSSAFAYKVKKTKSGENNKWNTITVTYYVNPSGGPPGSLAAIQAAMKTWTDVPPPLFVLSMAAPRQVRNATQMMASISSVLEKMRTKARWLETMSSGIKNPGTL